MPSFRTSVGAHFPCCLTFNVEIYPLIFVKTVRLRLASHRVKFHVDPSIFGGAIELLHLAQVDEFIELPTVHMIILAVSILNLDSQGFVPILLRQRSQFWCLRYVI
jgi:hypothetical protein